MIKLEKFTREDFGKLLKWIDSEEMLTNWAGSLFSYPLTHDSLEWYIDDTNDIETSDAFIFKAVDEASGKTVGHISLGGISRKNNSGRISRVLVGDEDFKGKGICVQMVKKVLQFGFEELQLHRISLGVYSNNKAALKCYQNAGFMVEGISRDILWFNNAYHSLVEMSILDNEWKTK